MRILTQERIQELSTLIANLKDNEPCVPEALVILIEDVYQKLVDHDYLVATSDISYRLLKKLQSTDSNDANAQELSLKLFEDVKERIDQVKLDQETHIQLNERIGELREINGTFSASLSARELQCQGLTSRIDELERDLTNYRDQLAAKSDELTAALALPKEDPQLRSKLYDLQNMNALLRSQIDSVGLEYGLAKESVQSSQEASARFQDQIRELDQKLSVAVGTIKRTAEEKDAYIAASKQDIEKAKKEIAEAANAAKNETGMRHAATVKNFEQRRIETESQLKMAKEDLQRCQEQNTNYAKHIDDLMTEMAGYKESLNQQASQIKDIEGQNPSREYLDTRDQNIESAHAELASLKADLGVASNEAAEKLDEARRGQAEAANQMQMMEKLQEEKKDLRSEITNLQNKYDTLRNSTSRYLTRTGDIENGGSVDAWATTVPLHTPQKMPPPALPPQRASGTQTSLDDTYVSGASTTVVDSVYHTPGEALEKALDQIPGVFSAGHSDRKTNIQNLAPSSTNPQNHSSSRRESNRVKATGFATILTALEPDVYALESTAKTLRRTNRGGSNFAQHDDVRDRVSSRRNGSRTGRSSAEIRHSTITRTTHRTEETTYIANDPEDDGNLLFGLAPLRPHTSSSLTDVEPIVEQFDSISNQDDLQSAYRRTREKKVGEASNGRVPRHQRFITETSSKHSRSEASNRARDKTHISNDDDDDDDDDELAFDHPRQHSVAVTRDTTSVAAATPKRRAEPVLKSVLKKTERTESSSFGTALLAESAIAGHTRLLRDKPSGLGVNRSMRISPMGGLSDYNRVVRGLTKNSTQIVNTRGNNAVPMKQPSTVFNHKFPLLPAPRRNSKKRQASNASFEDGEHCSKGPKAPRVSLHPATSRKFIPDSQESQIRY